MNKLKQYIHFENPIEGAYQLLSHYGKSHTVNHSKCVAQQAILLAKRYNLDSSKCALVGAFHDISTIISPNDRLSVAEAYGLHILEEERQCSLLLHQKLSALLAREVFSIKDEEVLSAIACHTTLKAQTSALDLILFIADKIAWDGKGTPPWATVLSQGLDQSLEHGALAYIQYILASDDLFVAHPWLLAAQSELTTRIP